MKPYSVRRPSLQRLVVFGLAGALAGGGYGVFFGAMSSLFEGGPSLAAGIRESWWWFAAFGAAAGLAISFERETLPTVATRPHR
jgi:hypothetical protein